jgi:hypothetical protein
MLALPACFDGPLTTGRDRTGTGGETGGWISAGGRGVAGALGSTGGGGAAGHGTDGGAKTCAVQNPVHPTDPPEIPSEIDVAWCNPAHTCATCGWRFFGVGIYVAGQPDANCTLASFLCPATPGGTVADGGVPVCPAELDGGVSDYATLIFDGNSWTPYECAISDVGANAIVASCQLGGFTCATSCAACP